MPTKVCHPTSAKPVRGFFVAYGKTLTDPMPAKCQLWKGTAMIAQATKLVLSPPHWMFIFKGVGNETGLTLKVRNKDNGDIISVNSITVQNAFDVGISWPPDDETDIHDDYFVPYGTYTGAGVLTAQMKDGTGTYKDPDSLTMEEGLWFAEFTNLIEGRNCKLELTQVGGSGDESTNLTVFHCPPP